MVQKYCRKVPACAYGAAKSQTNDRQTTDGRQTDDRRTARAIRRM